ncbi:hypothetical protein NVQ83_11395, partial [Neisseria gonorrhoeae]|nr:hypothetical protein [Neisseria gonorrhoeae]
VISAAYYIRDGEDNFAWAAACVEDLLEKMPPEAGRAPHPESPAAAKRGGGRLRPRQPDRRDSRRFRHSRESGNPESRTFR